MATSGTNYIADVCSFYISSPGTQGHVPVPPSSQTAFSTSRVHIRGEPCADHGLVLRSEMITTRRSQSHEESSPPRFPGQNRPGPSVHLRSAPAVRAVLQR